MTLGVRADRLSDSRATSLRGRRHDAARGDRQPWSIVKATIVALIVAAVVLVVAVLPAEYGIDPTGAGRLLGLNALATGAGTAIVSQEQPYNTDSTEFVLGSYETVSTSTACPPVQACSTAGKRRVRSSTTFTPSPTAPRAGYAESFDQQTLPKAHGTYVATFPGIHGWYWENPGPGEIVIRLKTAGFYTEAIEFRGNGETSRKF